MKALVVEQLSTMRSVLRRMLSMRGFEVAEAENGQQALDVLRRMGTADLVLVNWIPSEADNLDFITQLRRQAAHNTTVIILAASEPGMRELHAAFIAGADDYMMMPFTSMQMDERLARAGLT
jgi:two-component system chemotaxis response regulator CheY